MKNIQITYFFLIFTFFNCKAQTPILDISAQGLGDVQGAYYKDTQNLLNPFVGTYIYTNGSNSLKITLKKKTMSSLNGFYYEDLIIGEYQYIENGLQKVNTLGTLLLNLTDGTNHNINGNSIIIGKELGCDECSDTEKRLRIGLSDKPINRTANLDVRIINHNGQPAISVDLWWNSTRLWTRREGDPLPQAPRIPAGTYIMIKQ